MAIPTQVMVDTSISSFLKIAESSQPEGNLSE
jgi:hypothetical protein